MTMKLPIYVARAENFDMKIVKGLVDRPSAKYVAYVFEIALLASGGSYSDILDEIYDTLASDTYGPMLLSVLKGLPENRTWHPVPKGSLLTVHDLDIDALMGN